MKLTTQITILSQRLLIVLFAFMSFGTAQAQSSYTYMVSYDQMNWEDDDNNESDLKVYSALMHLKPVKIRNHPIMEAAFLERVSHAQIAIGYTDVTYGHPSIPDFDGTLYGGSFTYYSPSAPYAFNVLMLNTDLEPESPYSGKSEGDMFGFDVGYFLSKGHIIGLSYRQSKTDIDMPFLSVSNKITRDAYGLETKYVKKDADNTAINLEGGFFILEYDDDTSSETNTLIDLEADYYLNPKTGLSFGIAFNNGDDKDNEGTILSLGFHAFLSNNISVGLDYESFDADDATGEDEEELGFNVRGWF